MLWVRILIELSAHSFNVVLHGNLKRVDAEFGIQ